jgi:hypothetical protein
LGQQVNIICENVNFSIYFQKDLNIRKKIFQIEDAFSPKFIKPFQLIQVPDDAPEEIPRIQASSNMGHSQLVISQSNLSLSTKFDNGWENDWNQCKSYFQDNIELSYKSLNAIDNKVINFCGIVANIFIEFENSKKVIDFLNSLFVKNVSDTDLIDLNLKFTYKRDDKYYINYSFLNDTKYASDGKTIKMIPAYLRKVKSGLMVNIDVNDRFSFNFNQDYTSNTQEGINLLNILDEIVKNRLQDILIKGL